MAKLKQDLSAIGLQFTDRSNTYKTLIVREIKAMTLFLSRKQVVADLERGPPPHHPFYPKFTIEYY
jgi:hypothetical protein